MIRLEDAGVVVGLPGTGPARSKVLLHPIRLELSEHRIAIIGANGSGKSTLLRLLNGLILPTHGRVNVEGLDTRTDGRRVRRLVGFVFTDPLSQLVLSTPLDDVELSLRPFIKNRAERRDAARDLLAERGLADTADQSVYDLSGGERQLVALTSVLAARPQILVADEPTTLLDLRNRDRVRRAFAALDQQLIVATHDLELAQDADRVLVIEDGKVAVDDRPAPAIAAYRSMVQS